MEDKLKNLFKRGMAAHLPIELMEKIQNANILLAGLGGGSNVAELLVRKGFLKITLADMVRYESHNIRQRGCVHSSLHQLKTTAMKSRLLDINPYASISLENEGITFENVSSLVSAADVVIDMIDFQGIEQKVALYQTARKQSKIVVTSPSVLNAGLLYVFFPSEITFEEFFGYQKDLPLSELRARLLKRLVVIEPEEALKPIYSSAINKNQSLAVDPIGVDQASVMAVSAVENIVLKRWNKILPIPKGLYINASDPEVLAKVLDFSSEFTLPAKVHI